MSHVRTDDGMSIGINPISKSHSHACRGSLVYPTNNLNFLNRNSRQQSEAYRSTADSPYALHVGIASQFHTLAALTPHSEQLCLPNHQFYDIDQSQPQPNTSALLFG